MTRRYWSSHSRLVWRWKETERERLWAEVFGFAVRAHPERLGLRGWWVKRESGPGWPFFSMLDGCQLSSSLIYTVYRSIIFSWEQQGFTVAYLNKSDLRSDINDFKYYLTTFMFPKTWSWTDQSPQHHNLLSDMADQPPLCFTACRPLDNDSLIWHKWKHKGT